MPSESRYSYDSEHIASYYDEYGMREWDCLLRMELEACAAAGSLNMGTHIITVVQE